MFAASECFNFSWKFLERRLGVQLDAFREMIVENFPRNSATDAFFAVLAPEGDAPAHVVRRSRDR
jgi:hypothetical protein